MSATMKCPKCHTVTKGGLAGKVGFSGPSRGPVLPATPERYHFTCQRPNCVSVWYPDASQIDSK